jgi:flagellar motor switch protein FliN
MSSVANPGFLTNVELEVCVRFGTNQLPLREILKLAPGTVVSFVEPVGEFVELLVGGKVIARGTLLTLDGSYGFEVAEMVGCD